MVIQRPMDAVFVPVIATAEPDRQRKARIAAMAVAVSVAAHLVVGLYIYAARYDLTAPAAQPGDRPVTTSFIPIELKPTAKPVRTLPHVLTPRPTTTPQRAVTTTAPFPPHPAVKIVDNDTPPRMSDSVISFEPPTATIAPPVLTAPDWIAKPGPDAFSRYYPQVAYERGLGGQVTLACIVAASGSVRDCSVASETPQGVGFGKAAKELASLFPHEPADPRRRAGGRSHGPHPDPLQPGAVNRAGSNRRAAGVSTFPAIRSRTISATRGASSQPLRRAPTARITPGVRLAPTSGSASGEAARTPAAARQVTAPNDGNSADARACRPSTTRASIAVSSRPTSIVAPRISSDAVGQR